VRSRRTASGTTTVLFVCVHNSGRSQMAEALFNQLAGGRARAISAGTDPVDAVDATVVEAMREVGIDISGNRPRALTLEMIEQAHKVVTMGCGVEGVCPATFVETEDWELEDPRGKPLEKVREIRDQIRSRVADLVWGLESVASVGTERQ
jgi:arsenate reductase